MKRRGEVATALILAILSAIVIGAGVYYVAQTRQNTPGKMNTSEDPRAEQERKRLNGLNDLAQEIASELSGKFGEFSSLESYDFVPSVRMEWGEKALYQAGDRYCFMIPEEFVRKFISLTEPGTLEVSDDGSNFGIDIHNGKDFNLDKTLAELLHLVSGLKSGVSSNPVDMSAVESKIVNRVTDKSAESYGYVRFIFKTNVDDVYVVAVFSIDPNDVTHAKGRYIATGRKLLISRSSNELLEGIKTRLTFDEYFYTLDFDLNTPNAINSNSSAEECLEKFIIRIEE